MQRWGRNGGVQRFRCTVCSRSFNALTGTPLARLRRRDLWLDHAKVLNEGLSIRATGRRLGIHHNTTFRWRHRWLARPAALKDVDFQGIVEAVTVAFVDVRAGEQPWRRVAIPEAAASRVPPAAVASSDAGELDGAPPGTAEGAGDRAPAAGRPPVVVLVARDRRGATTDHLLDAFDKAAVAAVLAPLLAVGRTILCSPDSAVLAAVAGDLGVPHRRCPAPTARGRDDTHDLRHVRGYGDRLRCWMRRFRGVSTHHLGRYLGWRRLLDRHRPPVPPGLWLRLALGRRPGLDQQATVAGGRVRRGEWRAGRRPGERLPALFALSTAISPPGGRSIPPLCYAAIHAERPRHPRLRRAAPARHARPAAQSRGRAGAFGGHPGQQRGLS